MSMQLLIEEIWRKFLEKLRFAVAQKIFSLLNLPVPSNQFAIEESTSERFPKNNILGIWQSLIGTLTEKLRLVVSKEALFGYRRWSYVQRTFANFRPKSSYWNDQSTETLSSKMKLVQWEVDRWKSTFSSEEEIVFFIKWAQRGLHTDKLVQSDIGGTSPVCNFAHEGFRTLKRGKCKCRIGFKLCASRIWAESSKNEKFSLGSILKFKQLIGVLMNNSCRKQCRVISSKTIKHQINRTLSIQACHTFEEKIEKKHGEIWTFTW